MNRLYKGFVKTKNKVPLEPLKGVKTFKTYEEIRKEKEFAGVLADDVILIDIDNLEESEILAQIVEDMQLNCKIYQTTRGKHFVFKNNGVTNCGTSKKLACGLTADIKIGGKNTIEVLKMDGEERFVEWDVLKATDEYSKIPKFLFPVNSSVDFRNLAEGDGRNSTLFSYIMTLTNNGFSKTDSRETLQIINDYILKEKLSERELDTITRDDAFPAEVFYEGKRFLHNNFAIFMKNNYNIKRVNGQLSVYKDGVYVSGRREIETLMIKHIPVLKDAQRVEVLKYLEILCAENNKPADPNFIAFANGIYDVANNTMIDFNPEIVITNKIPWEYHPDAYSELLDSTLNKIACDDPKIRAVLEESIGYCFFRKNELSKFFLAVGEGSNGKSTFLDVVKNVLSKQNVSALDLNELDERFSPATLIGKLANVADDIADDFLQGKAVANLKKIVSGNEIKAEFKGLDAFFFEPYVKVFVSANTLPKTKSSGFAALKRRMVIIPFNAKFSKDDPDYDPYITWKLQSKECMEYAVRLGIEGLRRVIEMKGFTESEKIQKEIDDYEIENNPILLFVADNPIDTFEKQECKEVYRRYRVFCVENGFHELALGNFSKELAKRFNLQVIRKRVDGRQLSYYSRG